MYTIQWISPNGQSGLSSRTFYTIEATRKAIAALDKMSPHINHTCVFLGNIPSKPMYQPPLEIPAHLEENNKEKNDVEAPEYYTRITHTPTPTTSTPSSSCSVSSVSSIEEIEEEIDATQQE